MFSAKTTRNLPNNETHYTVELLLCRSGSICSKFLSGIHVSTIATNSSLEKKKMGFLAIKTVNYYIVLISNSHPTSHKIKYSPLDHRSNRHLPRNKHPRKYDGLMNNNGTLTI